VSISGLERSRPATKAGRRPLLPVYSIVLKRGEYQRFDVLHRTFGATAPVIWDRRVRERRVNSNASTDEERRRSDRRGPAPASWLALGFVVVQQVANAADRAIRSDW
jgi:hypothetical protein